MSRLALSHWIEIRVSIDTCLLIYAFEDHPIWGDRVKAALARESATDMPFPRTALAT